MRRIPLPMPSFIGATLPLPARAQDAGFHDRRNDEFHATNAPMRLDKALARFTSVTHGPASIDADAVKGHRTRSMRTAAAKGRFTPEQALVRMLRTAPLKGHSDPRRRFGEQAA